MPQLTLITNGMSYQTAKTTMGMLLLAIPFLAFAQGNEHSESLEVLNYNRIGREYIFKEKDRSTTHLRYLGLLRKKKGVSFKIVNSVSIWGQSYRATNLKLIYNKPYKYLGNYTVTTIDDLPNYIIDNKLVFKSKRNSGDSDFRSVTYIDFDNGKPMSFFVNAKGIKVIVTNSTRSKLDVLKLLEYSEMWA